MLDLSTIKLGSTSYNIKDLTARDGNPYSLESSYTTTEIGLALVLNDTSSINTTITSATTTTAGLMSAEDKSNLNNKPNVVELNNYITAGKIIPSWSSIFVREGKPVNIFYFKTGTNVPSELPANTEIIVIASTQLYDVTDYSYGRYYSYAVYNASTRAFLSNYTRYTVPSIILEATGSFESVTQTEDVKVVYHTKTTSVPYMIAPEFWKTFSSLNDVTADGVFLSCGDKNIIIAKDLYNLKWSSSDVLTNSGITRKNALLDFEGSTNTYKIVNNATLSGDSSSSYGAKKCYSYTTKNSAGFGILAGNWYLPSAGEMMMIISNSAKLNKALNVIGGTEISRYEHRVYMTSTEVSSDYYHAIVAYNRIMTQPRKSTDNSFVLPVAQISY